MNSLSLSSASERRRFELLLASVLLVAIPHATHLSHGIMAFFGLLIAWRFANLHGKVRLPSPALFFVLTVTGAGVVFGEYHRFYGREAGASLLVVGLGLKLMELKSRRDAYLLVFLGFLVASTQYLFSQSIPMAVYTLAIVVLLVTNLISLNCGDGLPLPAQLRLAGVMVAQAIPIMLVLFVFFPRVMGPLWTLPEDRRISTSGLSDTLEIGSITRLGLSQELAFRVDFEGPLPPPQQRYWRGPVFWHSDGQRWTLPLEIPLPPQRDASRHGPAYRYTMTIEPHHQRWVLAMDLPSQFSSELTQTAEYLLLSKDKIDARRQFQLVSHPAYNTGGLTEREKRLGLQLPRRISERTRALVADWQSKDSPPEGVVRLALDYFHEQPFVYTLNPPPTTGDPLDSFLFSTRRGFCEHYATSFVILMRIAGIPARVVTGYQGGQWNTVGNFLEVKQADAHAWAEVWLADKGWTRVDPTESVAPGRIDHGLDIEAQLVAGEIRFNADEGAVLGQGWLLRNSWRQARMAWASVDHAWDRWVLSYSPKKQAKLFARLGIGGRRDLALWLSGIFAVVLTLATRLILRQRQARPDKAMQLYTIFLQKMARHGFSKLPQEGALDFSRRIDRLKPEDAAVVQQITETFLRLRYHRTHRPDDLRTLARMIKTLRP